VAAGMHSFKATIEIIGINPFVFVPDKILKQIFLQAAKDRGHIPIKGTINDKAFTQTLVKYQGAWRLYINTTMLPKSPQRIGEKIQVSIAFDPSDRSIQPHPKWLKALKANRPAKSVFDGLSASKQKEIVRYIASLKTEESVDRNIQRAIDFLLGKGRFVGRDKP
jgi:hypothetical protein